MECNVPAFASLITELVHHRRTMARPRAIAHAYCRQLHGSGSEGHRRMTCRSLVGTVISPERPLVDGAGWSALR